MTSTSYVYSRLVGDRSRRVVTGTAVDAAVGDLRVRDVQVAQDVALYRHVAVHAVMAVFDDRFVVQGPGHGGQWGAFNVAHQGDGFVGAHHLLAEG